LNEGADVRAQGGFPYISVAPLCGGAKEWKIPHLVGSLLVPFLWVLGKPINETRFENPE